MTREESFKILLNRKGFTQKSIAKVVGLKPSTFSRKANSFESFEFGELLKMAAAMKMSVHMLIRYVQEGQGRSDIMEGIDNVSTINELEEQLRDAEEKERQQAERKSAFDKELKQAHKQLAKDIRQSRITEDGYISPLTKLKEKYPEFA